MRIAIRIVQYVFLSVVFSLAILLAGNALRYINFDPSYGFLRLKQSAVATGLYLPAYYAHVLIGGLILVAGFLQVLPALRTKFPVLHRLLGFVYVGGILFFAAPGGLVMSFFIDRGPWVLLSFLAQVSLWFYFTAQAYFQVRRGNLTAHANFMGRSYALTLAAITLRLYIFLTASSFNLASPAAYATMAWLSWVPNSLVAEAVIAWKRRQVRTTL